MLLERSVDSANSQLEELKRKLLQMAASAEVSVQRAVRSLRDRDARLAEDVRAKDHVIDRYEMELDALALRALETDLNAQELRLVTMAMRIAQDLERVGDEATTIARHALKLMADAPIALPTELLDEAVEATSMLTDAIDAFVRKDPILARGIIPRDESVDEWHEQLVAWLRGVILEDTGRLDQALSLMTVSRSLERVGDHATNIAEDVVFFCEAEDIRHPGLRRT